MNEDNQVQEAIEKFVAAALHLMNCFGIGPFNHGALLKYATAAAQLPGLPSVLPVQPLGSPPASLAIPSGGERIYVYTAGSSGCLRLSKLNNHKVYKIGTTCDPSIEKRLAETAGDKYGAAVRQGSGIVVEPGFDAWVALAIATSRNSADPGITVLPRSIAVDLPPGLTARSFDNALRKALSSRALHLRQTAAIPKRLTVYLIGENATMGGTPRVSEAQELYEFSPRQTSDGDMLLAAIEDILRRHRQQTK